MIPKFRAFIKKENKIRNATTIDFTLKIIECLNGVLEYEFEYVVLMQSTGLKDKNGVEIFEGDVVKVTDGESEEDSYVSAVRNYSNEGYPAFDIEYPPTYHYDSNVLSAIMCNGFETIEVIGNLWDNPELLEGIES